MESSLATTNAAALRHNVEVVRTHVGDRLILAAVKANGYGHGAVGVAQTLAPIVDWFGVATIAEGVELRQAGIKNPILKLSPALSQSDVVEAMAHEITLSLATLAQVQQVAVLAPGRAVHLKVDTGMRRIGCEPNQAVSMAKAILASGLRLAGVFSHLPVADVEAEDPFTADQIVRFSQVVRAIEQFAGPIPLVHLANSAAVLRWPQAQFSMVRPGIMLYGSQPSPAVDADLRPALTWTTQVSAVKRVAAGESVGYGRTWVAPTDRWLATIPVGYGDGFSRRLSNTGRVLIDGASYRIAGRVCMDQTMIDLGPTDSSTAAPVAVGDECVLVGRSGDHEITVAELATMMDTIAYEVTCLITNRVGRRDRA